MGAYQGAAGDEFHDAHASDTPACEDAITLAAVDLLRPPVAVRIIEATAFKSSICQKLGVCNGPKLMGKILAPRVSVGRVYLRGDR